MRGWILILILLFPFKGITQKADSAIQEDLQNKTEYYLNLFLKIEANDTHTESILSLINALEIKKNKFRNDRDFLNYLFSLTHRKVLKHYSESCSFLDLINSSTYNCLTGTALYAILLDHFNIDFKIIETNYHIFLIAKTSRGDVLFESTDPIKGFVKSAIEINKRIDTYRLNEIQNGVDDKKTYRYSFNLYNTVTLEGLLGLFYYNYSIDAYNHQHFLSAIDYLDRASRVYQSARLEEFSKIILLTLIEGRVSSAEKEVCLKKIQSFRKKMPVLASRN